MSKVALLISGLPRYIEKGFPSISKCLIEPNNPDVFVHSWNDVDGTFNYPVGDLYKPKVIKTENQKPWIHTALDLNRMMAGHARSYHREKFVEMLYSSWYSIQQANLIKEEYRLKTDHTYDYVIRARFDIHYNKPVVVTEYDKNTMHISNKWLPDVEMTDDRFAFASNSIMNAYCSGFNLLDYVQNVRHGKDGVFCGETLVWEMCRLFSIPTQQIKDLTANNISHMASQGLI